MSDHDDIQHLDPDQLLTGFSRTPFLVAFLLSIFAHVIFLGLFSMTPLLNMVLPQVEEPVAVEEPQSVSEPAEEVPASETEQTAPSASPALEEGDPDPEGPATPGAGEDGEESPGSTDDDFDIDLDVLNL